MCATRGAAARWFQENTTEGLDKSPHVVYRVHHMGRPAAHSNFRSWLSAEIDRQGIARRELARRLASKHPAGLTPSTLETHRRAIYRYLDASDPMLPNEQTRRAFAEALGVDPSEVPMDDEDDDLDLDATLQALAREQAELSQRLRRVLKARSL